VGHAPEAGLPLLVVRPEGSRLLLVPAAVAPVERRRGPGDLLGVHEDAAGPEHAQDAGEQVALGVVAEVGGRRGR
jgi:hypothetical protein